MIFREWLTLREAKETAIELANKFLNGRNSAWLSAKQAQWLRDVLSREMKEHQPSNRRVYFGEYELDRAAPNGACILRKAPATPTQQIPTANPPGQQAIQVSSQVQFMDAMLYFGRVGLRPGVDYDHDLSKMSFYPKSPEAFEKMKDVAIDKDYLIRDK